MCRNHAFQTGIQGWEKENYPKVILHSNQGAQFTSWDFVNFCKDNKASEKVA